MISMHDPVSDDKNTHFATLSSVCNTGREERLEPFLLCAMWRIPKLDWSSQVIGNRSWENVIRSDHVCLHIIRCMLFPFLRQSIDMAPIHKQENLAAYFYPYFCFPHVGHLYLYLHLCHVSLKGSRRCEEHSFIPYNTFRYNIMLGRIMLIVKEIR